MTKDIYLVRKFEPYYIEYYSINNKHDLAMLTLGKEKEYGSQVAIDIPAIFETNDGRRFVGQGYTDRLPRLF